GRTRPVAPVRRAVVVEVAILPEAGTAGDQVGVGVERAMGVLGWEAGGVVRLAAARRVRRAGVLVRAGAEVLGRVGVAVHIDRLEDLQLGARGEVPDLVGDVDVFGRPAALVGRAGGRVLWPEVERRAVAVRDRGVHEAVLGRGHYELGFTGTEISD